MPRLLTALGLAAAGLWAFHVGLGAPAPKPKDEPVGPPTAEQFHRAATNLKVIALAWHNYEAANGCFPTDVVDKAGKPILSWRVQILPYLETEEGVATGFKMDERWDSENNKKLLDAMPEVYAPVRVKAAKGMTYYQAFTGKRGLFTPGQRLSFANIADGTSNTFLVAEAAKPVVWSKPDDLVIDDKDVPALGGLFDGKFHVAFCDGSVQRFRKGVDPAVLRILIDPADGNVVPNLKDCFDVDEEKK